MQTQTNQPPVAVPAGGRISHALETVEREFDAKKPRALSAPRGTINVGRSERSASVIGGAGVLAFALAHPLRRAPLLLAGAALLHRGVTGHCYGYAALGLNTRTPNEGSVGGRPTLDLVRSVTIGEEPAELYRLWQQPGTLERVMQPLAQLERTGKTIAWRVGGPGEQGVEYRTRIAFEQEPEVIRWVPEEGEEHALHGSLHLKAAPREQGTEVTLRLAFVPPGGRIGRALVKLVGPLPNLLVDKILRRLKALAETGEIPTLEHNPAARNGGQD